MSQTIIPTWAGLPDKPTIGNIAGVLPLDKLPAHAHSWNDLPGFLPLDKLPLHNHDSSYYTKPQVDAAIGGIDLSGRVPYTGATGPVNLGVYGLTAGSLTGSMAAANINSGTLDDARLSSNVPRLNAANTFSADLRVGTANEHVQLGSNTNSTIEAWSFVLGAHYQLIGDSTGGGGPMIFRMGSGARLDWRSTARADSGTTDVSILRNATGPTFETRATGGLRVCNAAGTVSAPVSCSVVDIEWNGTNGTFLKYTDNFRVFGSGGSNFIHIGNTPCAFNVNTGAVGPSKVQLQSTASGSFANTNVVLRPNAGTLEIMNSWETGFAPMKASEILYGTQSGCIKQIVDPNNATVNATQILAPATSTRIYFGSSTQPVYSLNFTHVSTLENAPSITCQDGSTFGQAIGAFGVGRSSDNLIVSASTSNSNFGDIVFRASNTGYGVHQERARIKGSTGNLLIGGTTDNGVSKLQVNGGATFPGSFHTVSIGPADATYDPMTSAGNQVLFHSTIYGSKAAIGFDNAGSFKVNRVAIGPILSTERFAATSPGFNFAPAFQINNVSGNEHGMYSDANFLYLTTNRLSQLRLGTDGALVTGALKSSGSFSAWNTTPPAVKPTLPTNPTNAEIASLLSTYGLCTLV